VSAVTRDGNTHQQAVRIIRENRASWSVPVHDTFQQAIQEFHTAPAGPEIAAA
jgi:hypothetical protein